MLIQHWIGVDVCKDWLDVHCLSHGQSERVSNDAAGIEQLIQA